MIKKLSRACPICGCEQGDVLTTISLMPIVTERLPPDFDVCLCERCRFCFDDMDATQDCFDAYYKTSGKYAQANTGGSGGSNKVDIERWENVIGIIASLLPKDKRIVDIGCGKGGLLKALKNFGYRDLVGIEPSAACRDGLKEYGIASYSSITDCLGEETSFDCVVCTQVLEHIYFLNHFIDGMTQLLSPNGLIYVDVPDASVYAKHFHAPFYYFDREHINHFTPTSLNNLFGQLLSFVSVCSESSEITIIAGVKYPILSAVFQASPGKVVINCIDPAVDGLIAYKALSERTDNYPEIDSLKSSTAPILLWGLGSHLRRLMKKGIFLNVTLTGIIDRDRGGQGEYFSGFPILSPSAIGNPCNQNATIIITSVLYAKQIHESLIAQAFKGRIIRISE
jgi:SAM-dependent methyltransferase